jgi:Carboxypeptidase regulatory-like domain/TonB dependent receptor
MPLWRWCISAFLVSGSWLSGISSEAQNSDATATITGTVSDPSGARIQRAAVHIHGDHLDSDTTTNSTGVFTVTLPGGSYTLTVRAPGFRALSHDASLDSGDRRTLNFKLAIDAAEEIISVNPAAGTSAKGGTLSLSGDQLEILSDDPETLRQQLTAMAGGGIGTAAPQFLVDGFSNGQVPPKSAIRAIHINNDPYSAVYDRPGFGRVEIDTQAGGNQLHGMFDIGGTDSSFNSGNPFTATQPPYYQLLFRGNVSGPIGKATSYFIAGNTSDLQNNAVVNAVDPDAPQNTLSEAVPNPLRDDDYSFRIDHRFSQANQINGRYEIHRTDQTNAGVGLLVLPTEGYTNNSLTQTLQLADNEIFNPKIVNDLRFQYIRTRLSQDPNSTKPAVIVQGSFSAGGSPTQELHDNQDQYEFQENLSIDRGSHFIRTGLRYRLFRDSNDSRAGFNGQYIFSDVASYEAATPMPSQYSLMTGTSGAVVSTGDLGIYAEDEWKLTRSFTFDYGLRYETQTAIPDHNDPAPRVGFAWAIGSKKTKVPVITLRGGSGLFYQRLTASDLMPSVRQNGINQLAYFVNCPSEACNIPNFYNPNSTLPASSLSAPEPTIYRVDPHFRTSQTLVSSITAERIIGHIGTIATNFLEADGRHQYLLINANAPDPATGLRPLGDNQNIYQITPEGTGHQQTFFMNLNLNPTRRLYLFSFYVAQRNHSDANGPSWFASNSYNIRQDYGRDDSDIAQQFFAGSSINLPYGLAIQPFLSARSGRPFNITTGTDLNGDTIYNDRPAFATDLSRPSVVRTTYGNFDTDPLPTQTIIPYNYGHGPALVWMDLQVSEALHVGPRVAMKAAPQPAGSTAKPAPHPERPWTLSFSVEAQNLFNHVNPTVPVGVLSSPLFGRSLSVANDFSSLTAANRTILLHSTFTF